MDGIVTEARRLRRLIDRMDDLKEMEDTALSVDLRPVAILRPSKPSARMLGPSGRAHVAGLIAVHISSAERIAQCRGMLRSVAAQEIKPVPLVLSWSADDTHAAAFQAAWNANLQFDFNMRVTDGFDTSTSTVLRELAESNRLVQESAE